MNRTTANQGARRLFRRGWWLPLLITLTLWLGVLVYPVLRLAHWLLPNWSAGTLELLLVMVLPLTGRIAYSWRPGRSTRVLSAICLTWLGTCFLLLCLLLPFELLRLLLAGVGWPLPDQAAAQVLLLVLLALSAGSLINAQLFRVRSLDLPAPPDLAGSSLVQVSDVHIGSRMGGLLGRMVKRVNSLQPDRVVITGDLVDFRNVSEQELAPLADLQAPTWFCIGNHERYVDVDAICSRLTNLGIRVLRDTTVVDGPIQFLGIDDADSRQTVARGLVSLTVDPQRYSILLYHRPDGMEDAAAAGIQLMLAGHTHFGQIVPFNFLVRRMFPRICGLYTLPRSSPEGGAAAGAHTAPWDDGLTRLYVSPGTGTWGPVLRLGSRNEITRFRFAAAR